MKRLLSILSIMATLLSSCDSGDIYPKERWDKPAHYTVRFKATLSGIDSWPSDYMLSVAAFDGENDYSIIQKQVAANSVDESGRADILMTNISTQATCIELCVTNTLRQRIATSVSRPIPDGWNERDTLVLDAGVQHVGMFAVIQQKVFDGTEYNCSSCHGAVNPRASLSLAKGESHGQLVGKASSRVEGGIRVIPGNAGASILHQTLSQGNPAGLRYDHSALVDAGVLKLMDDWIDFGAGE